MQVAELYIEYNLLMKIFIDILNIFHVYIGVYAIAK